MEAEINHGLKCIQRNAWNHVLMVALAAIILPDEEGCG